MEGYVEYNHIRLVEEDQEKRCFITEDVLFCFVVMPFGLKNIRARYRWLANNMLKYMKGTTIEVYMFRWFIFCWFLLDVWFN